MAIQNSRKSAENLIEIHLNEIFVGNRRLRYLYHYEHNIVSGNSDRNKTCKPLFLGCDVLHECTISSANLPRFHAKHARCGLATKVNFQCGVRIVGIHGTGRGVWFYSIQGLFKIAFGYYTRNEQLGCLIKLREVWERQIGDPVLTSETTVVYENAEKSACSLIFVNTVDYGKKSLDYKGGSLDLSTSVVKNTNSDFEQLESCSNTTVSDVDPSVCCDGDGSSISMPTNAKTNSRILVTDVHLEKEFGSYADNINLPDKHMGDERKSSKLISNVADFVGHVNDEINACACRSNENLQYEVKLLTTYLSHISQVNQPFIVSRTINLVRKCLHCLSTKKSLEDNSAQSDRISDDSEALNLVTVQNLACETFSASQNFCLKEAVMLEVANWLGTEFFYYQQEISEMVTSFKQRNMHCIGNLPSAKGLISEVFPLSMQVFMCSWLQVPFSQIRNFGDAERSDDRTNLFPVIQVILELGNQSLISGVAHVLLSQLVQSDSVQ